MSDCRFGVSPVNYPDPDPDPTHIPSPLATYPALPSPYLPPHPYHTYSLPYHIHLGGLGAERFPSLPYSRLPYQALFCHPLLYAILPSSYSFLPSTPLHYLTLPSPLLSSSPLPHCLTLCSPTPLPSLSSHLLCSPTIPSPPFLPKLTYPTLQPPLPHPSRLFPSLPPLGYPIYLTLLSRPYPTILSPLLPFPRIPSPIYLPTYLPSHP